MIVKLTLLLTCMTDFIFMIINSDYRMQSSLNNLKYIELELHMGSFLAWRKVNLETNMWKLSGLTSDILSRQAS